MRRNVFSALFGLFLVASPGWLRAETVVSKEGLAEDVQILRRAMVLLHPGLYRFNLPSGIETAFQALEQDFSEPRTLRHAFLSFSQFTAKIRCARTYPSFFNQTPAVAREVWGDPGKLPFFFHWDNGRMIVTASADEQLRPGDVVVELNGVPTPSLGRRLLSYIPADGANDANRWAKLDRTGLYEQEAFDVLQPLLVPPERDAYHVRLAGEDAPLLSLRPVASPAPSATQDRWGYEVLDGRLAWLRMGTFDVYDGRFDWKGFLADAFADIKRRGLHRVALDIRGNRGGAEEVIIELARYVVWQPAVMPGAQRLTRYETVPPDLRPYLRASDRGFFDLRGKVSEAPGGLFLLRDAEREALDPGPEAHIAQYYLLVDGNNAASAFMLAQFLQENRLATLVGSATGGNQRGLNGGQFFFLKLPNSGIEIDIPLVAAVPLDARPDAGLTPDVRVAPEAALARVRQLAEPSGMPHIAIHPYILGFRFPQMPLPFSHNFIDHQEKRM